MGFCTAGWFHRDDCRIIVRYSITQQSAGLLKLFIEMSEMIDFSLKFRHLSYNVHGRQRPRATTTSGSSGGVTCQREMPKRPISRPVKKQKKPSSQISFRRTPPPPPRRSHLLFARIVTGTMGAGQSHERPLSDVTCTPCLPPPRCFFSPPRQKTPRKKRQPRRRFRAKTPHRRPGECL